MTPYRPATLRPVAAAGFLLIALLMAGCAEPEPSVSPQATGETPSSAASPTPPPTPEPTPTPAPTPRFTNQPDPELTALFPVEANGVAVVVPATDEFALTPGDFGIAFGELGARFVSLGIAYVEQPRTSLYAARVEGDPVATEDLEPHLATAGRYVGIAGLDADAWELTDAGGTLAWVRGEDNATAAGTMIYTWSSGEFVFLLIGVDDTVNRALLASLPGEPAPTPTPTPTPEPSPTDAGPSPTGG